MRGGAALKSGHRIAWLAVAAVALVPPALAPASDAPPPPAVLYAGVPADADAADQALSLVRLAAPTTPAGGALHIDELLGEGDLVPWGLAVGDPCPGAPVDAATHEAGLTALINAFRRVEDTDGPARALRASWRCLDAPASPGPLARASLYQAMGAAAEARHDDARAAFAAALAIDPATVDAATLGPRAAALLAEARAALGEADEARLRLFVPAGAEVWIDGRALADPTHMVTLPGGEHLVQLRTAPDAPLRGRVVTIHAGADALLIAHEAVAPPGEDDGAYPARMAALFAALHRQGPPVPGLLALLGASPMLIDPDGAPVALRAPPNRSTGAGRALLIAGAAAGAGGGVLYAIGHRRHTDWLARYEAQPTQVFWDANVGAERGNFAMIYAGGALAFAGLAAAATSVPLLIDGRRRQRDVLARGTGRRSPPALLITVTPDGVAVAGRF